MPPGRTNLVRNQVRIIGGEYRRRVLSFPDVPGLRPTPDRVRETVFNWLGQKLDGLSCLDAFAGSGALGFEARSRGAARVVMLERDRQASAALQKNVQMLSMSGVEVISADALRYLAQAGEKTGELFDVIFLDPPFALNLMDEALNVAATRLRTGGRIYAEAAKPLAPQGFVVLRQGRAGQSHFCLLERA